MVCAAARSLSRADKYPASTDDEDEDDEDDLDEF
jgi:hypothetical protein